MMGKREALHAILNGQRADRIPVIMNAFSLPVARYGYTMAQVMQQPDKNGRVHGRNKTAVGI